MPTYAYVCQKCATEFTMRRKFNEMDDPAVCPECKSAETKRQISLFYATNTGSSTSAASSPGTKIRHI